LSAEKPLTNEELVEIAADLEGGPGKYISAVEGLDIDMARRLVAEVRRLRAKLAFDPSAEAMALARKRVAPSHLGAGYENEVARVAREIEERLRSDEWLQRAADELAEGSRKLATEQCGLCAEGRAVEFIEGRWRHPSTKFHALYEACDAQRPPHPCSDRAVALDILRKHRDGKA
jgi:hypothetical protein